MNVHAVPVVVENLLGVPVREDHGAGLQARQVEGLGAGNAGDHVPGNLRREGSHGGMLLAVEDQVGVDLIGEEHHMVLHAQFRHAPQLLRRPDDAQGVVGIAQQEQIGALQLFLKVLPVHAPHAVLLNKAVFQHVAVPGLGHVVELGVHRRLDQHIAALRGEELDHGGNALHHTQAEAHEGRVDLPAVAALLPVPDGGKVALRPGGIAPDALLGPGGQGVDDGLGGAEIHIRDPQRDDIVRAEFLLPFIILGGVVAGTVHNLIKIIAHRLAPFHCSHAVAAVHIQTALEAGLLYCDTAMIANLPPGGKTIGAKNALPLAQGQFTCPEHCNLRRVKPPFGGGTQTSIDAAASRVAPKTKSQPSVSGCDLERRSSNMSAL